jgi:hypothetical protein
MERTPPRRPEGDGTASRDETFRDYGREGWPPPRPGLPDLTAVLAALEGLRAAVPQELQEQLASLIREVLLTLRALIDWYLERLERGPREPPVEDIPID